MKNEEIVKSNERFNEIIHSKNFVKNNYFVIYILNKKEEKPLFGVAAGKKLGNAVVRNKLKRQARMLIRENKFLFPKHHDYIIIMKEACLKTKFSILKNSFINLLEEKVNK